MSSEETQVGAGEPSPAPDGSAKREPPKSPFFAWWCEMLDIHEGIDSRWAARDVADIAFAAGYNYAMKQNKAFSGQEPAE